MSLAMSQLIGGKSRVEFPWRICGLYPFDIKNETKKENKMKLTIENEGTGDIVASYTVTDTFAIKIMQLHTEYMANKLMVDAASAGLPMPQPVVFPIKRRRRRKKNVSAIGAPETVKVRNKPGRKPKQHEEVVPQNTGVEATA